MKLLSLLPLLLFVLFISCSRGENSHPSYKITYTLEKSGSATLEGSNPMFGKLKEHFKITKDGNYWIFADKMLDQIFVYKSDGNIEKVIGERNKGPKGIVELSGYDVSPDNQVVIYDAAQRLLKIFDLEGHLISSANFLKNSKVSAFKLRWYKDNIIASVIENEHVADPHNSKLLAMINTTGDVDKIFGEHDKFSLQNNNYSFVNEIEIDEDENIIYTNLQNSPYIQAYDLNSLERLTYFGEKTASFKIPDKEISIGLPVFEINKRAENTSAIVGIFSTDCCIIQHMQILTKEWFDTADYASKKNIIVLYDKKTREFINEIPVEHALGAVHQNKLFFLEDLNPDNYSIGIYELVKQE